MATPARFKKSSKKFATKLEDSDFDRFRRKTGLSKSQIVQLKDLFDVYDYEQRGCINPKDLQRGLEQMAADQSHKVVYGYLHERLGKVGDDMVFEQLIDLVGATSELKEQKDSMEKIFRMFEDMEDECITVETLRRIAAEVDEELNDEELMYMMKFADENSDGNINLSEFQQILLDLLQLEEEASFDAGLNESTALNESMQLNDTKSSISAKKRRAKRR